MYVPDFLEYGLKADQKGRSQALVRKHDGYGWNSGEMSVVVFSDRGRNTGNVGVQHWLSRSIGT